MEVKTLDPTDDTPGILLDKGNNEFKFSGKSLPEDVTAFFTPILDWLTEYSQDPNKESTVEFRMEYFNSASSKQILDILTLFENIHQNGSTIHVKWYYQSDDEDMEEAGESYEELVDVPFEMIAYE